MPGNKRRTSPLARCTSFWLSQGSVCFWYLFKTIPPKSSGTTPSTANLPLTLHLLLFPIWFLWLLFQVQNLDILCSSSDSPFALPPLKHLHSTFCLLLLSSLTLLISYSTRYLKPLIEHEKSHSKYCMIVVDRFRKTQHTSGCLSAK